MAIVGDAIAEDAFRLRSSPLAVHLEVVRRWLSGAAK